MKTLNTLVLSIFALYLFGCASTSITGFKNPDFKGTVKNVIVYASVGDLQMRQTMENEIAIAFSEGGYGAISSMNVFSPAKKYTESEMVQILKQKKIEGALIVSITDAHTTQSYVPKSTNEKTKGEGYVLGDYLYYKSTTKTETTGGYYINKPVVSFESVLFNVEDGLQIWLASSTTKGNAFAKMGTLSSSLGSNILESLVSQGILRK